MTRSQPGIWFIGEARDRELRFSLREMERLVRGLQMELRLSPEDIPPGETADLIVVLQDWSDQYSQRQVNAVISATGGTGRLLVTYGAWCESDGRNRSLWPHAVRVPARLAPERLRRELQHIRNGQPGLPLTASRDERFEHNYAAKPASIEAAVGLLIEDRELTTAFAERLKVAGAEVVPCASAPDVIVWLPRPTVGCLSAQAEAVTAQHPQSHIVALMAMPHERDRAAFHEAGIEHLVPLLANEAQFTDAVRKAVA